MRSKWRQILLLLSANSSKNINASTFLLHQDFHYRLLNTFKCVLKVVTFTGTTCNTAKVLFKEKIKNKNFVQKIYKV